MTLGWFMVHETLKRRLHKTPMVQLDMRSNDAIICFSIDTIARGSEDSIPRQSIIQLHDILMIQLTDNVPLHELVMMELY